jgi:hypothetical protein
VVFSVVACMHVRVLMLVYVRECVRVCRCMCVGV